jgi:tannase
MRLSLLAIAYLASGFASSYASALSLADVCTPSYVSAHLPAADFYTGITLNTANVTASPVYNASVTDNTFFPDAVFDYCSVVLVYSHDGLDDEVVLTYWLPAPDEFESRYLSTGGE